MRYTLKYPQGSFVEDVQGEFNEEEARFWVVALNEKFRLREYWAEPIEEEKAA